MFNQLPYQLIYTYLGAFIDENLVKKCLIYFFSFDHDDDWISISLEWFYRCLPPNGRDHKKKIRFLSGITLINFAHPPFLRVSVCVLCGGKTSVIPCW